jgi:hypothetical protein
MTEPGGGMTLVSEHDPRVVEVVKRIRALKRLAALERMQTYKAQTALLKQLPEDVLAAVAAVLSEDQRTEEINNGTTQK